MHRALFSPFRSRSHLIPGAFSVPAQLSLALLLGCLLYFAWTSMAGSVASQPSAAAVWPLACRLSNYGAFENDAWTHLPSLGVRFLFMNVPKPEEEVALKKRLAESGLTALVFRGQADLSTDSGLPTLESQLGSCQRMGVRYLFFSAKRNGLEKEEMHRRLRTAGELARKHDVTIVLETHPDLGTNGDVLRDTIERVNHPHVRVNFDTGNIHFYNKGADAPTELKKVIDCLATVEIKDHNGKFEEWNFPPLGQGIVNIPAVLEILRANHYSGPITIEIEGVRGIERSREQILKEIEQSVRYLQRLTAEASLSRR